MSQLHDLSILETIKLLKRRELSAVDLVQHYLNRINDFKNLNAFTIVTDELALSNAKESDKRYATGSEKPFDGIPLAIKDLFCTKGLETTACSNILKGFVPAYESTVTHKLLNENGAINMGKTGMDEFAMGSTNTTSARGNVINPYKRASDSETNLVPGGSSGGSAAAVAARLCMGATASDTGGSIRQPASFTGCVGAKPTYGRCSRYGMISFASSLDQAGIIAPNVADSALLLQAMCGYDEKDSTSYNIAVNDFSRSLNTDLKGLKVGIPIEYKIDGISKEIENMWLKGAKWLKEQGAEVIDISLPHTKYALAVYYIIAPAEASSNLARYDGVRFGNRADIMSDMNVDQMYEATRTLGFGDEVTRRILVGTYVLSAGYYDAYFTKAQKVRNLILQDFKKAYDKVDVILTPTTPTEAFAIGQKSSDPIEMYLNDIFTVPASLAGMPAMSVPAILSEKNKLPLGLQLITDHFQEELMFQTASAIERAANFKGLHE